MKDDWHEQMACATACHRCETKLLTEDARILSVYDHRPICMACKKKEEQRDDYAEVSKQMIGQCMIDTELQYADPQDFCYHHFYAFKC